MKANVEMKVNVEAGERDKVISSVLSCSHGAHTETSPEGCSTAGGAAK